MKVHNLPVPIVMFSKSFHCMLSSSLGLSTNTFLNILNEESNKCQLGSFSLFDSLVRCDYVFILVSVIFITYYNLSVPSYMVCS